MDVDICKAVLEILTILCQADPVSRHIIFGMEATLQMIRGCSWLKGMFHIIQIAALLVRPLTIYYFFPVEPRRLARLRA